MALATTNDLLNAGIRVSFARVAREARVSTWLVYNVPEIKNAISAAIEAQQRDGITPQRSQTTFKDQSSESLRTDLALSREEIRCLRVEVAKIRGRLQLKLGAEAEGTTNSELLARIQEVEGVNATLSSVLTERDRRILSLVEERAILVAELEGKTEALRRMMFTTNIET
ncbi:hypothetical protein QN367_15955 [Cryobacterium sp. RTS3]|uniref:hypothetical protein n=1 Tax=Cryobacterium sp. RTS3 TaxID=3048643 RepID=UPI002B22D95E|nr:hypothetical protein [Cryobacterium sp. RTS3]MEB0000577.1 hypothetical protein [Cryobacterium sp. RTS3]